MSGFTPGPWKLHGLHAYTSARNDQQWIASADSPYVSVEEAEATARLISAAPDMYEALKATKQMLDRFAEFGSVDGEVYDAAESVVRKALSKADGREG